MTKARGPHVRQRVSTKLFFCALYGNKRWEKHPDLWQSFYFSLGPRHACSLLDHMIMIWICWDIFSLDPFLWEFLLN